MGGLEIGGAAAGRFSGYKDVIRKGEGSFYTSERTIQVGNSVSRQTDVVYSSGTATAVIKENGDMVATSRGEGSALAYSKRENVKTQGK